MGWVRADTKMGSVAVDAEIGNLRELCFVVGDRRIEPLHTAHWVGTDDVPEDVAPVERQLAGDFFCAPFGASDVEAAPPHGKSANSHWSIVELAADKIELTLDAPVLGAEISKILRISDTAPILYQTHRLSGGEGSLTVAHHPMVHLSGAGHLSVSAKRAALSAEAPLETGRNALACHTRTNDLAAFPASNGETVDLTTLPIASESEDFVTLVEDTGSSLGWSAIVRDIEDDIIFFLKDPRVLPVTMLWHSNAGRDYAPWNGRHTGVVGIEDGCAAGVSGHRAALKPNPVSDEGVPTSLPLGGTIYIHHVIGAVPRPKGWDRIADIRVNGPTLSVVDDGGNTLTLPFDPDFFMENT